MSSIILPHGRVNLSTGISKSTYHTFDIIDNDRNGGWVELWKSEEGKFKVVRNWVGENQKPWARCGMRTRFQHDQTGRALKGLWTLVHQTPIERLAELKEITGKRALDVACYK